MEKDIEELKDNKDNILFQIDMQLYNEFNDKFCEINEHLGDIYTYKDLEDIKEAETEKERKLLREAIKNLIKRVKELEEENNVNYYEFKHLQAVLINDYIPKSKIKEKIEELEKDIEIHNIYEENWNKIEVLKELLKED